MTMRRVWLYFASGIALGIILGAAGGLTWPHTPAQLGLTCRPTLPDRALGPQDRPILLLWGNSLLFDHDWTQTGTVPVNCARQGQTAQAATPLTPALPEIAPDRVLLAFGSVEAFIAARDGRPVDLEGFETALTQITEALATRWPEAEMILASVPFGAGGVLRLEDAGALNDRITARAVEMGAGVIDLDDILSGLPQGGSYDGVHLTRAGYAAWDAALGEF